MGNGTRSGVDAGGAVAPIAPNANAGVEYSACVSADDPDTSRGVSLAGVSIALTGATGYVGGRLRPLLSAAGAKVRCLVRRPEALRHRRTSGEEVVAADVLRPETLAPALRGAALAYYLVHSMGDARDFEENDRRAARNFAAAAREAGVRRIVYLGGLGHGDRLSRHLASRQEVGRILRESGVPTIEFRASIIIGSGSLSFEMIRSLTERLPIMVTPRWVRVQAQPIAIEDVLAYLVEAAALPAAGSAVFEIGGPDRVSYGDLIREYARQRGLRRIMIPVPVLSPRLSSLWLGLVTPLFARVGRKLLDGVRNETVVRDTAALRSFQVRPRGVSEAVARALANEDGEFAQTRWCDAFSAAGAGGEPSGHFGPRFVESHVADSALPPEALWRRIERIGGAQGWYYANGLWRLRGFLDLLAGGVGLRRGRRDPERLAVGDTVDWWRVEAVDPPRMLRLRAEMKLPGRAWLQFETEPLATGSRLRQTAIFDPLGLAGRAYWHSLYGAHRRIFAGMVRAIAGGESDEHGSRPESCSGGRRSP